jgi:hypothetical protein
LKFASVNDGTVADVVSMFQSSFQDIRDDFHVLVAVHPEALPRLNSVFIDNPQGTEAHVG